MNFEKVFQAHKDRIYRLCKMMAYDENLVDDLVQEVTINLWRSLPNFKGMSKIETWIYRIVVNTSITFNNRHKMYHDRKANFNPTPEQSTHATGILSDLLKETGEHLDSSDKAVLGLYLEGYSYKEISEILDITTNYVGVKLNRIKEKLKQLVHSKK